MTRPRPFVAAPAFAIVTAVAAAAAIAGTPPLSDAARAALADDLASASAQKRAQALEALSSGVCEDEERAIVGAALDRAKTPAARRALYRRFRYTAGTTMQPIPALFRLATTGDVASRLDALEGLRQLGPGGTFAMDAIVAAARDPDLRLKVAAAKAMSYGMKVPDGATAALGDMLRTPDFELRRETLQAFANLTTAGSINLRAAVGGLVATANDAGAALMSRTVSMRMLGESGAGEAIAPLAALMRDPDLELRQAAASALAELAKKTRSPALKPLFLRARDDIDRQIKISGVAGLARIGELGEALPTLKRMLWSHDHGAQSEAIDLAAELGAAAAPVAGEIVGLVLMPHEFLIESMPSDGREDRREDAEKVLKALGRKALPRIYAYLKSRNEEVREGALGTIWMLEPKEAAPATATLIGLTADRNVEVREGAVRLLARIGSGSPAAVAAIAGGLSDKSERVRKSAALALDDLGPGAAPAVPRLVAALADKDAEVAAAAADALGKVGARAGAGAGAPLRRAAGDKRGTVRMAAAQALIQTGTDEARGLTLLLETFDQEKPPPPWELQKKDAPGASPADAGNRLVAVVGPKTAAGAILPIATRQLASTDYQRREHAAKILEKLQLAAAPALATMAGALTERKNGPPPEDTLCRAIGHLGGGAAAHAPVIIERFKQSGLKGCGEALTAIGRASPAVAAQIQDAFRNECPRPYGRANDVLAAIAAPAAP